MPTADWDGSPAAPDGWPGVVPVGDDDLDADGDGTPETVVAQRAGGGAWVFTDIDADGFADHVLDLAADGTDVQDLPLLDALVALFTGARPGTS